MPLPIAGLALGAAIGGPIVGDIITRWRQGTITREQMKAELKAKVGSVQAAKIMEAAAKRETKEYIGELRTARREEREAAGIQSLLDAIVSMNAQQAQSMGQAIQFAMMPGAGMRAPTRTPTVLDMIRGM